MEAGAMPRVAPPLMPALTPRLLRLASDTRLVGLVRERRPGAFEALYDRHHRTILSFCRHLLGDQDEAEDAVQHTFMAAYTDLLGSEKPIHLRPWLFAIARNRCYSVLRARRERPTADLEEPATEGLASHVQRRQELRELVSDLHQLPDEQRAAIVLAELECLSHSEIGEVLGVPREKVKALIFQARESLLASRTARDTACAEIREQLACGRGGALRRGNLRRHLRECDGCRAYRRQVEHQRKHLALLLPVAPTLLLKEGILAAAVGAGGVAAAGGGLVATSAVKTGFVKGVVAAIVAGVGAAGTVVVSTSDLPVRALLDANAAPAVRVPVHHLRTGRPVHGSATRSAHVTATASAASVQQAETVSHRSATAGYSHVHRVSRHAGAGHRSRHHAMLSASRHGSKTAGARSRAALAARPGHGHAEGLAADHGQGHARGHSLAMHGNAHSGVPSPAVAGIARASHGRIARASHGHWAGVQRAGAAHAAHVAPGFARHQGAGPSSLRRIPPGLARHQRTAGAAVGRAPSIAHGHGARGGSVARPAHGLGAAMRHGQATGHLLGHGHR